MSIGIGQQARVTLELPDGTIFSGQAYCAEIRQDVGLNHIFTPDGNEHRFPHSIGWSMELRGIGNMFFELQSDFKDKIDAKRSAIEWICDWCGSVNPKERRKCESCGGNRAFVYG